ncbi:M20/M25/M40 family metallo-hydrolase [Catellatospora tritici]|uniref:M20/M25/M40 family metallo-hydrolase n=1 Tax=Catellatospora tritici TaxID=2851566 RepID=UPI001C2DE210|nr:M20/M25/M40 family metallo-hydrolase [Catellatospora tritici]MBV1850009.1 M20/M25/M40 family metallo-hydrolase [Catellatospora tritici]
MTWEDRTACADLRRLVEAESKTGDLPALRHCAAVLSEIGSRILGPAAQARTVDSPAGPILQWRIGAPPWNVGLIGHYDTVHPVGTLAEWPFTVEGMVARGPGVHDMKAGILTILYGVAAAMAADPAGLDGIVIHLCPDEEEGSRWSRGELAALRDAGLRVAAVFEGDDTSGGSVVTQRKSGLWVDVRFSGRSAHGSRPELGSNALLALADYTARLPGLADPVLETTVVPTRAASGTAINTVPEASVLTVDCRTITQAEQDRVLAGLSALGTSVAGVGIEVTILHMFPPMDSVMSAPVYRALREAAESAGLNPPRNAGGNGISDASHLSAMGVWVIDGLGPTGGGDHSDEEWVDLASMKERIALTAAAIPALSRVARAAPAPGADESPWPRDQVQAQHDRRSANVVA